MKKSDFTHGDPAEISTLIRKINEEGCRRVAELEVRSTREAGDPIFEINFSSETPVERWFGTEILGHGQGEVDMEWMGAGSAPLLLDHDAREQIGVIESAWIDERVGRAVVRFGNGSRAQEIRADVLDGIRRNVSVGYQVNEMELTKQIDGGPDQYRVKRWKPLEASFVALPADTGLESPKIESPEQPRSETLEVVETRKKQMSEKTTVDEQVRDAAATEGRTKGENQERARVLEIAELCKAHGKSELADEAIRRGMTPEDVRQKILDAYAQNEFSVDIAAAMNKTERETVREYSFVKAMREVALGTGLTGLEKEMHEEAHTEAKSAGRSISGSLAIPTAVLSLQRDLTVGTEGTDVVGTAIDSSFIGLLRNRMAVADLGARFLTGLTGDVQFPTISAGASASWEGENDAGSEQTQTFGQVKLQPNRVGCYTEISKQLLIQSTPDVEGMVRDDLASAIALAIDLAALNGSGSSNQPTGIANTSSVGDVAGGTNGAAPTWAHLVELETDVGTANADVGSLAYLTSAKVRGKLKTTAKVSSTDSVMIWDTANTINGYRAEVSNQVPDNISKGSGSNLSHIYFGNWNDLMVGQWSGLDIVIDPYSLATTNLTRITINTYADVGVRHAGSFSVMQDADAS